MKNDYNRYSTIDDIKFYFKKPIFKNTYHPFYDNEIDGLLVVAKNISNNDLDFFNSTIKQLILPEDAESIFQIPNQRMILIEGDSIEKFADSLLELLLVSRTSNKA